ncbi:RCC1 domain-containing protein [Gilliamella sp. Occ4-3]|uniref:RCC1 domain-containing protein n=1 Tax=Gilliamella sp. Occ4-3 TaxID=3120254 RepID=UPI00080E7E1B|nr:hypothetical protein [Gilliamella apicola]OCG77000.1 hypothetical protein A9G44_05660 [Gilliamella apicola]
MKLIKLMVLFASCLCFSLFANEKSDAVVLTTKSSAIKVPTAANSVDTVVTIENGEVWVWGYRNNGMQGNGEFVNAKAPPARASILVDKGVYITQVASGIHHLIALDDQGNVWGWGQNGVYEAGGYKTTPWFLKTPSLVLEGKDVVMINCGEYTSFALTRSGEVYAWGTSFWGQMANGKTGTIPTEVHRIPQSYFHDSPIVLIGAGYESAWAINDRGEVFAWGDEENEQYGHQKLKGGGWGHDLRTYPIQITSLPSGISGEDIATITGGNRYTAFLTSEGEVYAMGAANHLGIGFGYLNATLYEPELYLDDVEGKPYKVRFDSSVPIPQFVMDDVNTLYCRYGGCVAITNENEIFTWGVTLPAHEERSSLWQIMYGYKAMKREIIGNLTKVDGGKEHIVYWNDEGQAFGVGWNNHSKFGNTSFPVFWPGKELKFVTDEMKKVYGKDFVPGQG